MAIEGSSLESGAYFYNSDATEFLFGKLYKGESYLAHQVPPPSYKNKLSLSVIMIIYTCFVFFSLTFFFSLLLSDYLVLVLSLSIASAIISGIKNVILLKRFAPYLVHRSMKIKQFAILQVLLAYLFITAIVFTIGTVVFYITEIDFSATFWVFLFLLLIFIYVKLAPDIGLVSLSLGLSVFSNWGGIKNVFHNFNQLTSIHGKYSNQIAIFRLMFWSLTAILISQGIIWLYPICTLVFLHFVMKYEKANASSLLLNIRGIVQANSPVLLPMDQNGFIENEATVLPPRMNKTASPLNRDMHKSYSSSKRSVLRNSGNSTPFVARTINRIVDSIKDEEYPLPSNLKFYCSNCNQKYDQSGSYCQECGNPLEIYR
ncbi:MAG: hypothetical protein ACXAD7_15235 [Candidatus Kariarchaeaceae archaeon]|jgi:hypothetical protein